MSISASQFKAGMAKAKRKAKLVPLERQIHKGISHLLKLNAAPGVVWTHIANERRCSAREGAMLKALGVRAGVPDLLIIVGTGPDYQPRTYFLEVKTPKGRLSTEQKRFQADVEKIGIVYAVARSIDEAHRFLKYWGAVRRGSIETVWEGEIDEAFS